jgi:hypothetical protein
MRRTTREEWEHVQQDLRWTRTQLDEANAQVRAAPPPRVWKAAVSKAGPRQQQVWCLKCLQGGCDHPLAACGVATLCCPQPKGTHEREREREREELVDSRLLPPGALTSAVGWGQVDVLRPKVEELARVQKQLHAALERMAGLQATTERLTDRAKRKDREVAEYKAKAVDAIRSKEVAESKQAILQVPPPFPLSRPHPSFLKHRSCMSGLVHVGLSMRHPLVQRSNDELRKLITVHESEKAKLLVELQAARDRVAGFEAAERAADEERRTLEYETNMKNFSRDFIEVKPARLGFVLEG